MKTQQNAAGNAVMAEPCQKSTGKSSWDYQDAAAEALSINMAVEWIVQANSVLEEIQIAAEGYPEIKKFFRDRSIAIKSADWSACEMDEHVSRILTRQHILIKRLAGGGA